MVQDNAAVTDRFFEALAAHNFAAIREVMSESVIWVFLGQHPLAGVKNGIEEVVAFFDNIGALMTDSRVTQQPLVKGSQGNYLVECQHVTTHREDGNNLDHHVCVLWTIIDHKITEGRHFFADAHGADQFFSAVAPIAAE
jgi:ketosteroid isomerase-like protein